MELKFCPDCQEFLPLDAFTKNRRMRDGLACYRAPCARARVLVSRRRRLGPPKTRNGQGPRDVAPDAKWCPECDEVRPRENFPLAPSQANGRGAYCKPCYARIIDENRAKNHGSTRNYHLRHRYGITEAIFDEMFAEQNGVCAICKSAPAAHVDHDHADGRVRGLLCFNCNGALGQFRDRVDLMLAAVLYLQREPDEPLHPFGPSHVGLHFGPAEDPRPPDDPRPTRFVEPGTGDEDAA